MHQVAMQLPEVDAAFTPYYADGIVDWGRRAGLVEFSIVGNKMKDLSLSYLHCYDLPVDFQGARGGYDLVVTCSDLIIPKNIRQTPIVLVQEGMTDPENFIYHIVRRLRILPRWLASTSATGLSNQFDSFCVASEGYRELFIRKGVSPENIVVTGIPNFDNCAKYLKNDFPLRDYVLVCTSDMRETYKWENRKAFIKRAVAIAAGRQLVFKLHPNENADRAEAEIARFAPGALVFQSGNAEEMIANCSVLITRYSTTVYVGLALGKECYSDFDIDHLKQLVPWQNGNAASRIADVCREMLQRPSPSPSYGTARRRPSAHRIDPPARQGASAAGR